MMRKRSLGIAFGSVAAGITAVSAMAGRGTPSGDPSSDSAIATPRGPSASASVGVTLTGSDMETCELTFTAANPVNGTVSEVTDKPCTPGSPNTDSATVSFTADSGVCGPAQGSFTYTTNDGASTSTSATVTVDIPCITIGEGP